MWSHRGGSPHSHWGRSLPGPAPHALHSRVFMAGLHCSPGWPKCQQGAISIPSPARQDAAACTAGLVGMRVCISPLLPSIRQLLADGMRPGICRGWGERGLFGQLWPGKIHWGKPQTGLCLSQLSTAKNMSCCFGAGGREAEPPAWPLPAQTGPKHPQNQQRAMYMPGATKQKLFLYVFF